jgi:hypothetical protein
LADHLSDWFESIEIIVKDDDTNRLTRSMADPSSLHGLLKKMRDLGLPLLTVNHVDLDHADEG